MVFALRSKRFKQFFFHNITYPNMYSKSRVDADCPTISHSNVTIALLLASGERLTAKFRPEGDR